MFYFDDYYLLFFIVILMRSVIFLIKLLCMYIGVPVNFIRLDLHFFSGDHIDVAVAQWK